MELNTGGGDVVIQAILARRSTRTGYRAQRVDPHLLQMILTCGLAAPSSKNAQPWRLHVVESVELLQSIAQAMVDSAGIDTYVPHDPRTGQPYPRYRSTVVESAEVLRTAPAAIFIENLSPFSHGRAVLENAARPALSGALVGYGLELIGIGAAVENMWVAATALGLGAAFMGDVVIAEPQVRSKLNLVGDLAGVLVVGPVETVEHFSPADQPSQDPRVQWHQE